MPPRSKKPGTSAAEESQRFLDDLPHFPDPMFIMEPDGTLRNVNHRFANTFNRTPESFVGVNIFDHLSSVGLHDVAIQRKQMTDTAISSGEQAVFYDEQMGKIWRHTIYPIQSDGSVSHLFVIAQDVTDIKNTEKKLLQIQDNLQQIQKMELLGQLAGGIAHDFNNVLAAIMVNTEMAMLSMEKESQAYFNLENIRKSVDRSAQMVKQLLGFARRQYWAPKMVEIDEELSNTKNLLYGLIRENIEIHCRLDAADTLLYIDPTNLSQIITNLCVNSRDAIEGYGVISIQTEVVNSDVCEELNKESMGALGEYVKISVSDTGSGIDELVLPHIFEPFFTTKPIGKGTGLGLSTVYGLVKKNKGYIVCRSKAGEGTTFNIYLPIAQNSENYRKTKDPEPIDQKFANNTVLVVEDEPDVLSIIKFLLEKQGLTVIATESAEEAITIFEDHAEEINLIISDVILPKMNGVKMAEYIRKRNPDIKFIFMSGYSSQSKRSYGVFKGDVNFISKPFGIESFTSLVNKNITRQGR